MYLILISGETEVIYITNYKRRYILVSFALNIHQLQGLLVLVQTIDILLLILGFF